MSGTWTGHGFQPVLWTDYGLQTGYVFLALEKGVEQAPMNVDDYGVGCEMKEDLEFVRIVTPA